MSRFTKAERKKAKLRLALTGISGCGKTYSALRIATGMGGSIAVIDTEHDSSSLYATEFEFSSSNLDNHSPESYIKAIDDAEKEGFDIVIIDSLSHVWTYCKNEVDVVAAKSFKGNSWAAWSRVTPRYDALIQRMIQSSIHVIVTMRAKTETAQIEENGRKKVIKLGMKTEMRDGIEYEFTTVIDIDHSTNGAAVSKDRTHVFKGKENLPLDETIGQELMDWLLGGIDEPLVDDNQLKALNNMLASITHEGASNKVKATYPDFAKIKAKDYEYVADKLHSLIEWQQSQPNQSQGANQEQMNQGA
ncbi:ATP-binding protein [Psychrobacter sp. Arc29]|uniref:ATP-binding protein n=1 Tax=Psychrobacter sp. Arc29 TaxID=3046690 RepID=UPI00352FB1EE